MQFINYTLLSLIIITSHPSYPSSPAVLTLWYEQYYYRYNNCIRYQIHSHCTHSCAIVIDKHDKDIKFLTTNIRSKKVQKYVCMYVSHLLILNNTILLGVECFNYMFASISKIDIIKCDPHLNLNPANRGLLGRKTIWNYRS